MSNEDMQLPTEAMDLEAIPQQVADFLNEQTGKRDAIRNQEGLSWPEVQVQLRGLNEQYAQGLAEFEQQVMAAFEQETQAGQPRYQPETLERHWQSIKPQLDQTGNVLAVIKEAV